MSRWGNRTVGALVATIVLVLGLATVQDALATPADSCTNVPTGGPTLRAPYLPDPAEAAVRDAYAVREQPADLQHAYLVHVPDTAVEGPVPVVLTMHGLAGSAKQHLSQTQWQVTADAHGFILVAPNGHRSWDFSNGSIDTDYLRDVIADVRSEHCVDDTRIYVTGHSMGGFMTQRVACDLGDVVAAGASYAAGDLSIGGPCTPGVDADGNPVDGWERMPLASWHGTDDGVVNYTAGRRGMREWSWRYDCDTTPHTTAAAFGFFEVWERCLDGVDLVFRTLDEHGHAWPDGCGGQQSGTGGNVSCESEPGTGPWPAATDLTEELWAFLSAQARDQPAVAQPEPAPTPPAPPGPGVVASAADRGIETGFDSDASFRRSAPLASTEEGLSVELVFRVDYGGDGGGLGDKHPICPTSNPGPGTQSMEDRVVAVSAVDRRGDVVEVKVETEPVVRETADGQPEHVELVHATIPGPIDESNTVIRASYAGDVVKFWWGCGTPPARYKETVEPTRGCPGACGRPPGRGRGPGAP